MDKLKQKLEGLAGADSAAYGNSTVTINNPSATDENGDGVSISGRSHTVKVLSDVNFLSDLKGV